MDARRKQLIEHFMKTCSMAIEEAKKVADMNCKLYDALGEREGQIQVLKEGRHYS